MSLTDLTEWQQVRARLRIKELSRRVGDCWEWQGPLHSTTSRPRIRIDRTDHMAARLSYELNVGPIPAKCQIRQTCDNSLCVNPEHQGWAA